MIQIRGLALALGASLILVAACGSSDGGGDGAAGGAGGSSSGAAASLIDAQCSATDVCCQSSGTPQDHASCVAFYSLGDPEVDPDRAAACTQALRDRTADGTYCTNGTLKDGVDPCAGVLSNAKPTATTGEKCAVDHDCATTAPDSTPYCDFRIPNGMVTVQQCVDVTVGRAGDACLFTLVDGQPHFLDAAGNPPVATLIASCNRNLGLICDPTTYTCGPTAATGAACREDLECGDADWCSFDSMTDGMTCVPRLADGADCADVFPSKCGRSSFCSTTCQPLGQPGAACTTSEQCASGFCSAGKCQGLTSPLCLTSGGGGGARP